MNDLRLRLVECFANVFPDLNERDIPNASRLTVGAWDSLATVTLMSVLEEEFDITVMPNDITHLVSFEKTLSYLQGLAISPKG